MPLRQLYLISYPSSFSSDPDHPLRFSHWQFFLPLVDNVLKVGKVIHALGSPEWGFTPEVTNKDIERDDRGQHIDYMLQKQVDLEALCKIAEGVKGLERSKDPESGKPNCQDWLFIFAHACVEEGLLDKSVLEQLKKFRQENV